MPTGRISKNPNVATLEARSLFLVGDETGTRITSPKEIARRTGMHERTVREYQKHWQNERNEMLKSVHDGSLVLNLSKETLENAKSDEIWIRSKMDELKIEASETDEIAAKLYSILDSVDEIVNLEPKHYESLVTILSKYLEVNSSKKSIISQFMALEKRWHQISGVATRLEAGAVALKAIASTQAKHEALEAIEKRKEDRMRNANGGEAVDVETKGLEAFDVD